MVFLLLTRFGIEEKSSVDDLDRPGQPVRGAGRCRDLAAGHAVAGEQRPRECQAKEHREDACVAFCGQLRDMTRNAPVDWFTVGHQILKQRAARTYVRPTDLATAYAACGRNKEAFTWLEKAYREHDSSLVSLKTDITLDKLRPDPRFQDLLRGMNFPQ